MEGCREGQSEGGREGGREVYKAVYILWHRREKSKVCFSNND